MTVPVKTIQAGIANAVSDLIGVSLSEIGNPPNNLPAVFISRENVPKPSYPYAVVDYLNMEREGMSFVNVYQDINSDVVHESNFIIAYLVSVYGDVDNDTASLTQQLSDLLMTPSGLSLISTNTSGVLRDVSDISFFSQRKNDLYEEVSRITVEIAYTSTLTDTSVGTIENITIDESGLYQDIDDADPVVDINVTVP